MSDQNNPAEFAQSFEERAQLTQILYQTLVQSTARSQPKDSKGVKAVEAELLHSLSAAVAGITSRDELQRRNSWISVINTAQFAIQLAEAAAQPQPPTEFEPVDE